MFQSGFDPRSIHCQHNVAIGELVSIVRISIVAGPFLNVVPSKASLHNIVASEQTNGVGRISILLALERKTGEKIDFIAKCCHRPSRLHSSPRMVNRTSALSAYVPSASRRRGSSGMRVATGFPPARE